MRGLGQESRLRRVETLYFRHMKKISLPIIVAALLLTGAGCSFGAPKKDVGQAQPAPAAAPQGTPVGDAAVAAKVGACPYDDKTLCRFLTNWRASAEMTMRTTSVVNGKKTESTFETDGKGSSRMTYSEGGKEQYATVMIGRATYSKQAGAKAWTKTVLPDAKRDGHPEGDAEGTPKFDFSGEGDADADAQAYVAMGMEPCGKLNCHKYEVTMTATGEKQHIWFDDKEYRLRRILDLPKDGISSDTEFSYEPRVIAEPAPVVEVDLNAMMNGALEGNVDIEAQLKAMQGGLPNE